MDAAELRKLEFEGDVGEIGMWRRLMNCGASLTVEGRRVEVIYRDLDAVELLELAGAEAPSQLRGRGRSFMTFHAKRTSVPTAIALHAGGPQVAQPIAATVGDRDEMVYIGGRLAAVVASRAVDREHLPPDRLPASTARAPQPAPLTAALGGQPPAAEAGDGSG